MSFSLSGYNEFQSKYKNESDRSVIILAASYLDAYLEQCLRDKLADDPIKDKVFSGYAPLSTFSAKNDISLLLGLLTKRVHKDINTIRKIRNICAHEPESISFSTNQVKDLCSNLWPAEGIPVSDGTKNISKETRDQYLSAIFWCLVHIDTENKRTTKLTIPKFHFMEDLSE